MSRYFAGLNYSLGDEDSRVELAMAPESGGRVAAVAGSGGRILPLLAKAPDRLACFDTSEIQLHFTRLRVESARALELEEFAAFWGYPPSPMPPRQRERCFRALGLPAQAAEPLSMILARDGWREPLYAGRFERALRTLARINRFITGARGRGLFACRTLEEQRLYLRTRFPRRRWRMVVALLANAAVLNTILYRGEFPKKNIPGSTFANFLRIFDRLFRTIPVRESFFAQLCFFGRLQTREAGLLEVDPELFPRIKEGLRHTAIDYECRDILRGVGESAEGYDFVSLSDLPSFLPGASGRGYLQTMREGLPPGAVVVARGNLRVVEPDARGFDDISGTLSELAGAERTQLWHIAAYRRR